MDDHILQTIALSAFLGTSGLLLGRWLRIPSILFYMVFGLLAGPSLLGVVDPKSLQGVLMPFIEVAVAIIIFEAGLALPIRSWRNAPIAIRQILTITLPLTGVGAFAAAKWIAALPTATAALFGSLIVVTGPTVIGPLLKSVALSKKIDSVLRWESLWADCIGVLASGIVLEMILSPPEIGVWLPAHFLLRFLGGILIGAAGGWFLGRLLLPWVSRLGDPTLPGIVTLSGAVGVFYLSGALIVHSGVMASAMAGIILSRFPCEELESIKHFKDQVTTMIVAFLFVFLSAQLDSGYFDTSASFVVGAAMFVTFIIRPVSVLAGLKGTSLRLNERLYIGIMGPRGIISAAVASYYALSLTEFDLHIKQMHLLVFTTIFISGGVASILGKPVARMLKVSPDGCKTGVIVVGGGLFAMELAKNLKPYVDVVIIDSDSEQCLRVQNEGLLSRCDNALSDELYEDLLEEGFRRAIVVTTNSPLNNLIAQKASLHLGPHSVNVIASSDSLRMVKSSSSRWHVIPTPLTVKELDSHMDMGKICIMKVSPLEREQSDIWPLFWEENDGCVTFSDKGGSKNSAVIGLPGLSSRIISVSDNS